MEVTVLQQGKNTRGFWTLLQSTDADGFVCTAFATTVKELKAKDGKVTIPSGVYAKLDWKY